MSKSITQARDTSISLITAGVHGHCTREGVSTISGRYHVARYTDATFLVVFIGLGVRETVDWTANPNQVTGRSHSCCYITPITWRCSGDNCVTVSSDDTPCKDGDKLTCVYNIQRYRDEGMKDTFSLHITPWALIQRYVLAVRATSIRRRVNVGTIWIQLT